MQLNTDLTGLGGITFAAGVLLLGLRQVAVLPVLWRIGLLFVLLVVLWLPVAELSPVEYLRGITGDLSVMGLLFLVCAAVRRLAGVAWVADEQRVRALKVLAVVAVLFYPLALGLGPFDPYRLGYGSIGLLVVLGAFALWAALYYSRLLALGIALAVVAWGLGWYESPNLWDYLLDPWLGLYALGVTIKQGWQSWRRIRHGQSDAQ